jgi:geranylgeranyl diphosphate synthase, type II
VQPPLFLQQHALLLHDALDGMLAERRHVVPERLWEAMRYSLMAGGKRIRPALLFECFLACGGADTAMVLPAAMGVECMHTYSLIHDDLPCMDDDDLRRGHPTCHRQFDEATAVLAADALQALSFELLTETPVSTEAVVTLVQRLANAAGAQGMVGGQMLDMQAEAATVEEMLEVERIHLHKTGALLGYCCEAGAMLAGGDEEQVEACIRYGRAVGLLFQIADDILDATASSEALGKSAGKDEAQAKATYVSVLGLERARELAAEMQEIAVQALAPLGEKAEPLRQLASYIGRRER